ncbi:hypothetical protein L207DRAFT_542824 [Hyaloscypha variabilis F]|uniref:RRM domain-containing protein n=1 Tax=Hyaloscypha variabilis (strain UAMH 11265 / GT02V1 / F) TaxID=1149755 RepID=A0A2J6RYQ9_HYAVF|nr:hypothetical protein L207DRAFT_542824 [Hyaloscypha variabilis F]
MAPSKPALDLNAMINADRARRKHEAIAAEIFGRGRRSSAPGAAAASTRKTGPAPSLASRIGGGIAKRTVSNSARPARASPKPNAGNVDAEWTHDLHALNNPAADKVAQLPPRGPRAGRGNRNDRLYSALNGSASSPALNNQFNIVGSAKTTAGMSIRGLAGPYIVIAKNLALGTTAADIESAMTPVGGVVLGCRLIAERPKVIAELIFESKEGADNVVETFNNQNADGNILNVYHKAGPVPPRAKLLAAQSTPAERSVTPTGPRADANTDRSEDTRSGYGSRSDRTPPRRQGYDNRDDVIDGSYGFDGDRMDTDDRNDGGRGRGLYSDNLIGNRGRGRGNSRDRGRGERGRGYR